MGLLRILLVVIIILICALLVLPKNAKENFFTRLTIKYITASCAIIACCISGAIYYWQDVLLTGNDGAHLIEKKIFPNSDGQSLLLELSNYDLKNFSPATIATVLAVKNKVNTLVLNNFDPASLKQAAYILSNSPTIKTLIINASPTNALNAILPLLQTNNNIHALIIKRSKLNDASLVQLTDALAKNSNITSVALEYANLSNQDIPQLCELVATGNNLSSLSLAGNQFDIASLIRLATSLQKNKSLQNFKINIAKPTITNQNLFLQTLGSSKIQIDFNN